MMITEEQVNAARKLLRSGIPEGEIKNDLVLQGFTEEEIKQVFAPRKYNMRTWYLVFGVLFLLAGCWRLLVNGGFLFLIFAAAMFYQYYDQVKKDK